MVGTENERTPSTGVHGERHGRGPHPEAGEVIGGPEDLEMAGFPHVVGAPDATGLPKPEDREVTPGREAGEEGYSAAGDPPDQVGAVIEPDGYRSGPDGVVGGAGPVLGTQSGAGTNWGDSTATPERDLDRQPLKDDDGEDESASS